MRAYQKHQRYCLVEIDTGVRSSEFRILRRVTVIIFETKGEQIRARDVEGKAYVCLAGKWRERSDGVDGRAWAPIDMRHLIGMALEWKYGIVERSATPQIPEKLAA
jgi:hypothetical protein